MCESDYSVECKNGHSFQRSLEDLLEILEYNSCPINNCNAEIVSVDPEYISVECVECGADDTYTWQDALLGFYNNCLRCQSNTGTEGNIKAVGTYDYDVQVYKNFDPGVDSKKFEREGRSDYWELVIHYTSKDNFLSIMEDKKIQARVTGYFRELAICLTEAPKQFVSDFHSTFGNFGIVFKKGDLIRLGGGPALYIPEKILQIQKKIGFSREIMPFINLLRLSNTRKSSQKKRYDYLHEREWRFPKDLLFSELMPVGVILPSDSPESNFYGNDGRKIFEIVQEYRELH